MVVFTKIHHSLSNNPEQATYLSKLWSCSASTWSLTLTVKPATSSVLAFFSHSQGTDNATTHSSLNYSSHWCGPYGYNKWILDISKGANIVVTSTILAHTYHEIEGQDGVVKNSFEEQAGVIVFGFVPQAVQFFVGTPVRWQQLWHLIAGFRLKVYKREGWSKKKRQSYMSKTTFHFWPQLARVLALNY